MVDKEGSNPRLLDIIMTDLKWRARLSYVDDVIFGQNKRVKRKKKTSHLMIIFLFFCLGMVLGMLILQIILSLF